MPFSLCHTSSRSARQPAVFSTNIGITYQQHLSLCSPKWRLPPSISNKRWLNCVTAQSKHLEVSLEKTGWHTMALWIQGLNAPLCKSSSDIETHILWIPVTQKTPTKSNKTKTTQKKKNPKLTGLEKPSPKQVSKEKLKTNPGQKGELGFEPTRRLHTELAQDYCHSRAGDSSLCAIPTSAQMDSNPFCYANVPKSAPLSQVPLQVQQHGATSPARQPDSSQMQKAAVKFSIAFWSSHDAHNAQLSAGPNRAAKGFFSPWISPLGKRLPQSKLLAAWDGWNL